MKEKIYMFFPSVLLFVNMIIFALILLLFKFISCSNKYIICMVVMVCQSICNMSCGFLIRKLNNEIYIDDLTGLYNRKFFNKKIYKMKPVGPISLILLDLDNFKNINDTYGHLMGDSVLQQFAEILNFTKRKDDVIVRWGGEEFIIILPETSIEEAYKIGNRIRMIVEKFAFSYDNVICKITVSMGVTSTETVKDIRIEQLLQATDKALYQAKEKKNYISVINV